MRRILYISLLLLVNCHLQSCSTFSKPIKMGVIGDPHYLSEQLMDNGDAVKAYVDMSGKDIRDVPLVLDQVLSHYLESDIEVLLIPGDITKDGEKQSHLDFQKKLQPLKDKGVKVYVIPGNHDINIPHPVGYKGKSTYKVESVTPKEFAEIYADCGYGEALMRDSASLSYVAALDKYTWLVAVDVCRYQEYTSSTISGGRLLPETEKWVTEVLNQAKAKNIRVIGMMHHGLVEHIAFQAYFFKDYLVDDWGRLASLFADLGMKAVFTGHFHANDITMHRSSAGNEIYDIETGSLSAYAFPYRFVELNETGMDITTENVSSIEGKPNLREDNRKVMEERARHLALEKINAKGMHFPEKTLQLMANLVGRIFVQHLEGDEVVDDAMKESINQLVNEIGSPMPVSPNNLELDFFPADNNVKIVF